MIKKEVLKFQDRQIYQEMQKRKGLVRDIVIPDIAIWNEDNLVGDIIYKYESPTTHNTGIWCYSEKQRMETIYDDDVAYIENNSILAKKTKQLERLLNSLTDDETQFRCFYCFEDHEIQLEVYWDYYIEETEEGDEYGYWKYDAYLSTNFSLFEMREKLEGLAIKDIVISKFIDLKLCLL